MKQFIKNTPALLLPFYPAQIKCCIEEPLSATNNGIEFEKLYSQLLMTKGYYNVRSVIDEEEVILVFDSPTNKLPNFGKVLFVKNASYCDVSIKQYHHKLHMVIHIARCRSTILYRFNQLLSIFFTLAKLNETDNT